MSITSVKSGLTSISLALDNNYMEPIATTTVGVGGINTIVFNDIPQNYKHLQVRASASQSSGSDTFGIMNFNSSNSGYFALHQLYGQGTSATVNAPNASTTYMETTYMPSNATSFNVMVMDILDYTNVNKFKTVRNLGGFDVSGAGFILFRSGLWQDFSPISSISFAVNNGALYSRYSKFSLYGIKG